MPEANGNSFTGMGGYLGPDDPFLMTLPPVQRFAVPGMVGGWPPR